MKHRKARVHKGPLRHCFDPLCIVRAGKPPTRPAERKRERLAGAVERRVARDESRMRLPA